MSKIRLRLPWPSDSVAPRPTVEADPLEPPYSGLCVHRAVMSPDRWPWVVSARASGLLVGVGDSPEEAIRSACNRVYYLARDRDVSVDDYLADRHRVALEQFGADTLGGEVTP